MRGDFEPSFALLRHMNGQEMCQAGGYELSSDVCFCTGCGGEVLDIASDRFENRHLIPRCVIKHATCLFLEHAAPLLEEKRDAAS